MKLIRLECRRMISRTILLVFLVFVLIASIYDSQRNLDRYHVRDEQGIMLNWRENLSEARNDFKGVYLDKECMQNLQKDVNRYGSILGENILELVSDNYGGKTLEELSNEEMEHFFQIREAVIFENLVMDTNAEYTKEEVEGLMDRADALSALPMDYAEGWKVLAGTMGSFAFLMTVVIAVLLLPLFGRDSAVEMEELIRSCRYGKRQLDTARFIAAYLTATVLYVCGMVIYFVVVMLPFGFDGANQPIQSNVRTFFSLYNITYLQQFLWNLLIGYAALLFMVSLVLLAAILFKYMLAAASLIAIYLVMLVIINQIYLYPLYHWFANFMPVRMTDFWHFYVGNEVYRICGFPISCMSWSITVSLILSAIFLIIGRAIRYRTNRPSPTVRNAHKEG